MLFTDRTYSVLLVSSSEKFNASVKPLLPDGYYSPISIASNVAAAKRKLIEHSYDFVIINAPLPDDFGIRFAIDTAGSKNSVVLILVQNSMFDDIYEKVMEHGVFTLSKPLGSATFQNALQWMAVTRESFRRFEKKASSVEEKMAEIRMINRAKWILIDRLSMTEEDAHRYIEKQAMDRSVTKLSVAETIIKTYS